MPRSMSGAKVTEYVQYESQKFNKCKRINHVTQKYHDTNHVEVGYNTLMCLDGSDTTEISTFLQRL